MADAQTHGVVFTSSPVANRPLLALWWAGGALNGFTYMLIYMYTVLKTIIP